MFEIALIFVAVVLLVAAFVLSIRTYSFIDKPNIRRTWIILFFYLVFFLISYTSYIVITTALQINIDRMKLLTSIIFFNSALFVMLLLWLSHDIIRSLASYSHSLELKVKQRTHELEESNRLKELFISVMNHDVKNPVSSIKGFSELLRKQTRSRKLKKYANNIKHDAYHIEKLIDDAKLYSKMSQHAYKEKKQQTDLKELLNNIKKQFDMQKEDKNIKISIQADAVHVKALPILEEVFINLLDNAIKYSREGAHIKVRTNKTQKYVTILTEDEAQPIKKEHENLIFQRFERGDAKKAIKGTGLGLAICKEIVALHKGKIWVEPKKKGNVFKVRLPL